MTQHLNILIAEDNAIVAADISRALQKDGHTILGPFGTVVECLCSIDSNVPDFAFLDVELIDGRSFRIAQRLEEKGVPFIFVTARTDLVVEAGYTKEDVLVKPFRRQEIAAALSASFVQS